MLASGLITLREGLEAALIVGIVLSVLRRLGYADRVRLVWAGVAVAVGVSVIIGVAINRLGVAFEGQNEEIFEGVTMLLAAAVLTWMLFWMYRRKRQIQAGVVQEVQQAAVTDNAGALFSLAFVAVAREGIETVLFLTAAAFTATRVEVLLGGVLGLALAVGLGWLTFAVGRRLNVRLFFRVTGVLLLLFAAGLVARGVHELQEATLLPALVEPVWNANPILDEGGGVGSLLKTLFGYNGDPSLLEVLAYGMYFVTVGVIGLQAEQHRALPAAGA